MTSDLALYSIIALFVCSGLIVAYVIYRLLRLIEQLQNKLMSRNYSEYASFEMAKKAPAKPEVKAEVEAENIDEELDALSGTVPNLAKAIPTIADFVGGKT